MIKSNSAAFTTSIASLIAFDNSEWESRVARERIYTRLLKIAFIRMRSPSNAPPVFRFVGSMDNIAILLSSTSFKKRRISSSVNELFPAPPVPVIPMTGMFFFPSSTTCSKMVAAVFSR